MVWDSSESLAAAASAVLADSALSRSSRTFVNYAEKDALVLKLITWNIDGLSEDYLEFRTEAVCKKIKQEKADIVFLQEVIPESTKYLLKHLDDYYCLFGRDVSYFIGILLKKSTVDYKEHKILEMGETKMMRNALKVKVTYNNMPLCLFTSHLESMADGSERRKKQLKFMFNEMLAIPSDTTVIFAGDMNLRDKELIKLGGLPSCIEDLWTTCGSREECEYTFDMTRNDNLDWPFKFKPRCRFDRVYVRHSSPCKLNPVYFDLIGLERLLPHRCFPSDHWGIMFHFDME